jgi:hypothetical protein
MMALELSVRPGIATPLMSSMFVSKLGTTVLLFS